MESKGNIIVLAGTKWQIPLVKRIKAEGYAAIVFNLYEDSPAFEYADDYRTADILDIETCLKLSRPFAPVAVVSDECDIATPSVALLAEKLGLPSIGMDKAKLYTNKYRISSSVFVNLTSMLSTETHLCIKSISNAPAWITPIF